MISFYWNSSARGSFLEENEQPHGIPLAYSPPKPIGIGNDIWGLFSVRTNPSQLFNQSVDVATSVPTHIIGEILEWNQQ